MMPFIVYHNARPYRLPATPAADAPPPPSATPAFFPPPAPAWPSAMREAAMAFPAMPAVLHTYATEPRVHPV